MDCDDQVQYMLIPVFVLWVLLLLLLCDISLAEACAQATWSGLMSPIVLMLVHVCCRTAQRS